MNQARKDDAEQYVRIDKAAEHVGLKVGTVYRYVSLGQIPYWKRRGFHLLFLISDLDRWMTGELEGGLRGHVPAGAKIAA